MDALSIKDLNKTYKNGTVALNNINLNIKHGDFFALLGPNGAGKSTLIGILASLVNKTSGEIKVFGYDLDKQNEAAKSCIGIVPQEFNCTVLEKVINIVIHHAGLHGIARSTAKKRAELYLKQLDLWDKRNETALTLSGGMKRRLMVARALIHEPKLLILDEPTAGVDTELRHSFWDFITKINKDGTTVILTTHYLEEAERLCKNVAIIDEGKIIENTSTNNLLNKLNKETFHIYLNASIRSASFLENFNARLIDESVLEIEIDKGESMNNLFTAILEQQVQITSVYNKTKRLEELFLNLTSNKYK